MTNKFPIGSQWKTRAGHRAVVVDVCEYGMPHVWHESCYASYVQGADGKLLPEKEHGKDLLTPWTEPRKGSFWVNVQENGSYIFYDTYPDKETADKSGCNRLACIEINWTEGQGI